MKTLSRILSIALTLLLCTVPLGAHAESTELLFGYDLDTLYAHKSAYLGDNSNTSALVSLLPLPDERLTQRFISLETSAEPYGLTIYYEMTSGDADQLRKDIRTANGLFSKATRRNALVLYSLIDNLGKVTVAVRFSPSSGVLDDGVYEVRTIDPRDNFQQYGDLSALWDGDRSGLLDALRRISMDNRSLQYLTLEDVHALAQKGNELTLHDLDSFYSENLVTGLIVRQYPLEEDCMTLLVGSTGENHAVQYARLFKHKLFEQQMYTDSPQLYVDIRTGDIDTYLSGDTAGPLVEEYLDTIESSPVWSSNTWDYIAAHPEECEAIRVLDYHALPTLCTILEAQDVGLRSVLAAIFVDEILLQRMFSSFATPETFALDARARAALSGYTGQKYAAETSKSGL